MTPKTRNWIEVAGTAKRESKYVEFKDELNIDSRRDLCAIVKDLVAISNSGGGIVVVGVNNTGKPTEFDTSRLLSFDQALLYDKIKRYIGDQALNVEIVEIEKEGAIRAAFQVDGSSLPIIFTAPGTYSIEGGKQQTEFGIGTVYFRHGAKSEPATSADLANAFQRALEATRKQWLGGIRKVVNAPIGHVVEVMGRSVRESRDKSAFPIRLVDDPSAPAYRKIDADTTYPYRQKEALIKINKGLPGKVTINSFDFLSVRTVHRRYEKPIFQYKPKFSSRQYSQQFVDDVLRQYNEDSNFFTNARSKYNKMKRK